MESYGIKNTQSITKFMFRLESNQLCHYIVYVSPTYPHTPTHTHPHPVTPPHSPTHFGNSLKQNKRKERKAFWSSSNSNHFKCRTPNLCYWYVSININTATAWFYNCISISLYCNIPVIARNDAAWLVFVFSFAKKATNLRTLNF